MKDWTFDDMDDEEPTFSLVEFKKWLSQQKKLEKKIEKSKEKPEEESKQAFKEKVKDRIKKKKNDS